MSAKKDQSFPGTPACIRVFGLPVHLFTKSGLLNFISAAITGGRQAVIANLNLHGLYWAIRSDAMERLLGRPRTFVHIDGMPIAWLVKLKCPSAHSVERLAYLDWGADLLALAARKRWRVCVVGSTETLCAKGVSQVRSLFPGLEISGRDGYFDVTDFSPESKQMTTLNWLREINPDILIVGMGMPRQEAWVEANLVAIPARVVLMSGAFIEYFAGGQTVPPRWIGRLGFEWLYRLACNPRRYGHRYLVEPFALAGLLLARMIKRRELF